MSGYSQVELLDAANSVTDLHAKICCAVTRGVGGLSLAGANAALIAGVVTRGDVIGRDTTYARYGSITKAIAGAAIADAALLTTDVNGHFVTATTGQHVHARALEPASGANSKLAVELGLFGVAP